MSTKASPWENGYQESFYNNFKTDLGLEFDRFEDTGHFLEAIHHTLYSYNHQRIHSALKMPPAQFHANYLDSLSTKRGAWQFGIHEKEKFSPASLLKVPVLMAFYKEAELDPSVLTDTLNAPNYDYEEVQNIQPEKPLVAGNDYTVEQLLESMITQSDNNAYLMLSSIIDEPTLVQVYKDIGINIQEISQENPHADFLTVREYASLFRVLYNTTYLNEKYSEQALAMLTRSTYKNGLTKYLPKVSVAHKFGERRNADSHETQLHDCGIVYYPEKPYLICIMTKGTDLEKQAETIANLSQKAFLRWKQME